MRALLDTHSLLWFLDGDERLSAPAREIIEDGQNDVLASIATLWEIAIKHSVGKLDLGRPFSELFPAELEATAISVLDLEVAHLSKVVALPFHHRDPFDRLMIVQAMVEQIPIVGNDPQFDAYGITRLW